MITNPYVTSVEKLHDIYCNSVVEQASCKLWQKSDKTEKFLGKKLGSFAQYSGTYSQTLMSKHLKCNISYLDDSFGIDQRGEIKAHFCYLEITPKSITCISTIVLVLTSTIRVAGTCMYTSSKS